jgi:hypothetical protein
LLLSHLVTDALLVTDAPVVVEARPKTLPLKLAVLAARSEDNDWLPVVAVIVVPLLPANVVLPAWLTLNPADTPEPGTTKLTPAPVLAPLVMLIVVFPFVVVVVIDAVATTGPAA